MLFILPGAYLGPIQTPIMEIAKNFKKSPLPKKSPLWMYDRVLNAPLDTVI